MVLATGADIKNRFLIAGRGEFFPGPELGDLSDARHYGRFRKGVLSCLRLFRPRLIACDLHPGYFSTRLAQEIAASQKKPCRLIPVQHHHAHIAGTLQEHAVGSAVIGVSFDGTGYGADGRLWGSEFLLVDGGGFRRLAHFKYMKMPGADKAVAEPWRMLLSICGDRALPFLKKIKSEEKRTVLWMLSRFLHAPLTSSAGRVFDAAAALLGLCLRASYEAEGPIRLERICRPGIETGYDFTIAKDNGCLIVDPQPIFLGMLNDIKRKTEASCISAKFHNAMAETIVRTVGALSRKTGVRRVALSGGVFQNRYLRSRVIQRLNQGKFTVFTNERLPVNDLNIAWGQYYIASRIK